MENEDFVRIYGVLTKLVTIVVPISILASLIYEYSFYFFLGNDLRHMPLLFSDFINSSLQIIPNVLFFLIVYGIPFILIDIFKVKRSKKHSKLELEDEKELLKILTKFLLFHALVLFGLFYLIYVFLGIFSGFTIMYLWMAFFAAWLPACWWFFFWAGNSIKLFSWSRRILLFLPPFVTFFVVLAKQDIVKLDNTNEYANIYLESNAKNNLVDARKIKAIPFRSYQQFIALKTSDKKIMFIPLNYIQKIEFPSTDTKKKI